PKSSPGATKTPVPKPPGGEVCVWNLGTRIESVTHQQERKNTTMRNKIINYIRAGYPGLYLVSHEEQRVALEMTRIAQELKYNLVFWSVVDGLVDTQKGTNNSANDPLEALIAIKDLKEKTLILLRDFHLFLQDPNPILIRQLKDVLQMAKTKSKTLIILGCRMVLPPELERELTVIEFALPGKEQLNAVLSGILESANIKSMEAEIQEKVIDAASGLMWRGWMQRGERAGLNSGNVGVNGGLFRGIW